MKEIKRIDARLAEINDELVAIEEMSADEMGENALEQAKALSAEVDELKEKRAFLEDLQAKIAEVRGSRDPQPKEIEPDPSGEPVAKPDLIPARAKACKTNVFASAEDAYISGMYLAHLGGNRQAGDILAAQNIGTDADGGYLVPDPLSNSLINLLEEYGVARRICKRIPMSASTWTVPKVTEHASISYPAEAAAISDSDMAFSQITLTAKKMAGLVKMSNEVREDSIVPIMDTVVQSLAYQMAIAEDQNLFNGVASAINANGIKADTNVADTNVASVAALALDDLTGCMVSLGNPILGARNEWYMNPTLFHGPIRDLLNAIGGTTQGDVQGDLRPRLFGAPVNFVNVLPGSTASTAGDLLAVYGDASLGCYFGDRRAQNFRVLNELYANTDQVGVQVTQRIDIAVANPEVLAKITITG